MNRYAQWVKYPTDDKTSPDVLPFKIYYPWQFHHQQGDGTNKYGLQVAAVVGILNYW
jgi:hypothetical protein